MGTDEEILALQRAETRAVATVEVGPGETGVPILRAPPLTLVLPIMGNSGPPPGGDTCVVTHPGPNDIGSTCCGRGLAILLRPSPFWA